MKVGDRLSRRRFRLRKEIFCRDKPCHKRTVTDKADLHEGVVEDELAID